MACDSERTHHGIAAATTSATAQSGKESTTSLVPQPRRRRTALTALACTATCALALAPRPARADDAAPLPVRYAVDASLDRAAGTVTARGRITLTADANGLRAPDGSLGIWLYADRTAGVPPSVDDLSFDRHFPYGVSRGGYRGVTLMVDGCAETSLGPDAQPNAVRGRFVRLPVCATATEPLTVRFTTSLSVPARYGTLGRASDALSLGDPWYPVVVDPSGVPARGEHAIDVRWDGGVLVASDGVHRGGQAHVDVARASHASLFVLERAAVHEEIFAGVRFTWVGASPMARSDPPPTSDGLVLRDIWESDAAGGAIATMRRTISLLRRLGFTSDARGGPRTMADRVVIVEAPERERLAVALPGVVVVSDRAFRLLPIDAIQRFHELALARRLFTALVTPRVEATEPIADRAWVADLDGSLLVDVMLAADADTRQSPQDLIGFAGFHPAVDQLLYAPKVAFRSAYFHDIEERDPDRDGADRALNDRPFGHLVLEKLRDRLGGRLAPALGAHLLTNAPLREATFAAARANGAPPDLERRLTTTYQTWLAATPRLAYRLAHTESTPNGSGYAHAVTIERLGATAVEEPVVVELVDAHGARTRRVWDAPGATGVVRWESEAELRDANIDPDERLIQDPALAPDHPRFDDELRHKWRPPILSSFALSLSVAEKRPDAAIDFTLKRRYDVRHWFGATAATAARGVGARLRYGRGIGGFRDLNSTLGAIVTSVSGLRSENGFGGSTTPVSEIDVGSTISWDTRTEFLNPRHGWGAGASVSVGAAREDHASVRPSAGVAVRAEGVHALHPRHVLAGAVGGGATVCPALAQQLQALSGRQILRAYAADELLGCGAAYAIGEYRWLAVSGLYGNLAQVAWFKGLELVPFAAAGLLSSRTDVVPKDFYGEVGGGVRFFVDFGGVQPGVISVDLGLPLSRRASTTVDSDGTVRRRPPVGLYLSFDQPI